MKMINDRGDVKHVPENLAGFMQARGWEPVDATPVDPETPVEEPDDNVVEPVDEDDDADNDVVDEPPPTPGHRGQRTTYPAEEQS